MLFKTPLCKDLVLIGASCDILFLYCPSKCNFTIKIETKVKGDLGTGELASPQEMLRRCKEFPAVQ